MAKMTKRRQRRLMWALGGAVAGGALGGWLVPRPGKVVGVFGGAGAGGLAGWTLSR